MGKSHFKNQPDHVSNLVILWSLSDSVSAICSYEGGKKKFSLIVFNKTEQNQEARTPLVYLLRILMNKTKTQINPEKP